MTMTVIRCGTENRSHILATMTWRPLLVLTVAFAGALLAGGCSGTSASPPGTLNVVAAFYPLAFVAERIGGDAVHVRNLTPPGAEPHDVELSARDTAAVADADLVVYLRGFAAAVDDAVAQEGKRHSLDVTAAARLAGGPGSDDGGEASGGGPAADDPHFWLDPTRLSDVAAAIAGALAERDPSKAAEFSANSAALRGELAALDGEFAAGLRGCASHAIVTSHAAFGYLAEHYHLTEMSISGLLPDVEPSPGDLARIADSVRSHDVTTVFTETLVSPAVAKALASETGTTAAVLDPIEGLSKDAIADGEDYFTVMRANLATLRSALRCA